MRNPDDTAAPAAAASSIRGSVRDEGDDDDDSIDESQLQEYREELNSLQGFPVR
jgi:hypothetical protein